MKTKIELMAMTFATIAHAEQERKYTGNPYIEHPWEVAEMVRSVPNHTPAMLAAAWLHDTIEDCGVTAKQLHDLFGVEVTDLVVQLTDVTKLSDGNRAKRKEIERNRLAMISKKAKTVKLADLISNSTSIIQHDPEGFGRVYIPEKRALLPALEGGDLRLWTQAQDIILDYERRFER